MAMYNVPGKQSNRKRNKTGYNLFFTHHVNEMKSNDTGVPSERGSVARLVGNAWKVSQNDRFTLGFMFHLNHFSTLNINLPYYFDYRY